MSPSQNIQHQLCLSAPASSITGLSSYHNVLHLSSHDMSREHFLFSLELHIILCVPELFFHSCCPRYLQHSSHNHILTAPKIFIMCLFTLQDSLSYSSVHSNCKIHCHTAVFINTARFTVIQQNRLYIMCSFTMHDSLSYSCNH
ncbi:hypothetical protein BsWGS_22421 [Bradybaena similaris]